MISSFEQLWIQSLSKDDLHLLIDSMKSGDREAISQAVVFTCAESLGIWHNRARAKICRYFKNHPPANSDCQKLVDAIVARLTSGTFYEQFKDQLGMAIKFDSLAMHDAAKIAKKSEKEYVRRYAAYVFQKLGNSKKSDE